MTEQEDPSSTVTAPASQLDDSKRNGGGAEEEEDEEALLEQVMLTGLAIFPPRQRKVTDGKSIYHGKHAVTLPPLRFEEPVQSLRAALSEVIGYAHLTNFRFEILEKPTTESAVSTPMPLVSPYTGKDAVVVVPLSVKTLETEDSSTSTVLALDDFGTLAKLAEHGFHEKQAAFEIVLERYDVAGVKDHVHRLRSLLAGSAPSVVSLSEEEERSGEENAAGQAEYGSEDKKESKSEVLPPLPLYTEPTNRAADGIQSLKDFFYKVSGESPEQYSSDSSNDRANDGAVKSSKKKKKGKGCKSTASDDDDSGKEEGGVAPAEFLSSGLTRWNELDEQSKVPFTIRYSGFHPPPASRRLMGDLAYLELVPNPAEEEEPISNNTTAVIHITATPTGFYVNGSHVSDVGGKTIAHFDPSPCAKSCFSHALLDCLLQASGEFKDSWAKALAASKERASLLKNINRDAVLSFFRLAARGDFDGFASTASAVASVQQALDGSLSTPTWVVPRPRKYPKPGTEGSWSGNLSHSYNPNRAEEDLVQTYGVDLRNGGIRDWNEELQMARELPTTTLHERIERARLLHKVMTEFGEAALLGVRAICDGHVSSMNPNEGARSQVFLHNNIFFSRAVDAGPETFKVAKGDRAARKAANRDIQCISTLHRSEKSGLYTLATVLIDYLGTRFVCQSILPGILIGDKSHTLLYGAVESGVPLKWDEELHNALKETVGEPLMIASRPVYRFPLTEERMEEINVLKQANPLFPELEKRLAEEKDGVDPKSTIETCIPVEAKGILGSDQRKYLLDFGRLTPRDANWVPQNNGGTGKFESVSQSKATANIPSDLDDDEWTVHVLRPELVSRFTQISMSKYMTAKRAAAEKEAESNEAAAKEKAETNGDPSPTNDVKPNESSTEKESPAVHEKESEDGTNEKEEQKSDNDTPPSSLSKEDMDYLQSLKLNINVFLPHMRKLEGEAAEQLKIDEERAAEAATFLWDEVLPKVTRAIKDGSVQPVPMDGKNLTEFLHRNGVNCRYLGRLAYLAREEELRDEKTDADLKQGTLTLIERRTMPKCWLELLECEIVARAAKHVLDSYLKENGGVAATQPAQTIASFLSALVSEREETAAQTETRMEKRSASQPDEDEFHALTVSETGGDGDYAASTVRGRYEIWQDIEKEVGRRFRYSLVLYNNGNKSGRALYLPLLRRVCQRTGVRVVAKDYEVGDKCLCSAGNTLAGRLNESYPISPLDIVDVLPLMKHAASYNEGFAPCFIGTPMALPPLQVSLRDARVALERAHIQTSGRALGKGLELAQEAASLYQRVTDNAAHPGVIEAIELMSNIFLDAGDAEMAAANGAKALALSIQSGGFDTPRVFSCNMMLFQMFNVARDMDRAMKHLHAAIYVLELMAGPRHSEIHSVYQKLGTVYAQDEYNGKYLATALKFYNEAAKRDSCDRLMDGITAKPLAKVLFGLGDYKAAVDAEKKAFQVLALFLGREHQLTKESENDLINYTKLAVERGSQRVENEKIKEETAKAEAVAAALTAEEEKRKKNNKNKKKKPGNKK